MQVTFDIPDQIAAELGPDLSRAALEALALEGYRSGQLSEEQVRIMLGFAIRYQVHGFLKEHGVPLNYTVEDFEHDSEVARQFSKWSSSQTPRR
jgi:hypothetical protein